MPSYTQTQFNLQDVMPINLGAIPSQLCYGFGIIDQHGGPLLTFSYQTMAEAQTAHATIKTALATAFAVTTP
jgi:hypothetical protein